MDKEKLKEMARDKRFISGIYNYCDQWCERCPQTSRCLNHAMIEEEFTDRETQDIRNESFWTKLSEVFKDTLDMLKERALSEGIDLDALDTEIIEEEDSSLQETVRNHEIARAAKAYADMAENWLEDFGCYIGVGQEVNEGTREQNGIEDAFEVVRWYQNQIYVKLVRAISGLMEEEAEISDEGEQYARDSEGSAKVALIGIDRSIAAWGILGRLFPTLRSQDVHAILTHLERLRRLTEKYFPGARGFLRPGFDRMDLNG